MKQCAKKVFLFFVVTIFYLQAVGVSHLIAADNLTVKINNVTAEETSKTVTITVTTENVVNLGSFGFRINFNPAKISFVEGSAVKGETISNWLLLTAEVIQPGVLVIGGLGITTSATQSGELLHIEFNIENANPGDEIDLALSHLDFCNSQGVSIKSINHQNGKILLTSQTGISSYGTCEINGQNLKLTATVVNSNDTQQNISVIVAFYSKNHQLKSIYMFDEYTLNPNSSVEFENEFVNFNADNVKIFVWNNLDEMKPLCKAYNIKPLI